MAEVLSVKRRERTGKINNRKLRGAGKIPAVLYGAGGDVVHLEVSADQFAALIRHGEKVAQLEGDVNESVVMREVQWDTFGSEVLHIDFFRSAN